MHTKARFPQVIFGQGLRPESATLAILFLLLFLMLVLFFMIFTAQPAQAQTYTVLHNFTGGADGGYPYAGLTMDAQGNLYGTTCGPPCPGTGGNNAGTVFKMSKRGSHWVMTPLYAFRGGTDGAGPTDRVIFGPDGTLYGTTYTGGEYNGGTVFRLQPPPAMSPSFFGSWKETVLYSFQGGSDGANPELGDVVFDQAGNLYGTTAAGGTYNNGTVFRLTPSSLGWTEAVLYSFTGGSDGGTPLGTLEVGPSSVSGTAVYGGNYSCNYGPCGTIFQLTESASGWILTVLHAFQGGSDGNNPVGGMSGGAGTTSVGGANGGGTAFLLNNQMFNYSFPGNNDSVPWPGPWSTLIGGPNGPLGTTYADGAYHYGSVFYMYGCAGWGADTMHDFAGGADGAYPTGILVLDANGNTFGTTSSGGAFGYGLVFEITPGAGSLSGCGREL